MNYFPSVRICGDKFAYMPHGAPWVVYYGSGLTGVFGYNYRLQPNVLYAIQNSNYNRTLFVETPNWGGAPNNNGNLMGESVGAATTPQPLGSLPYFNQSFTYDKANRLAAAGESGSGTWSRSFGYDQWGNMAVTANSGVPFNGLTPYGSGQYNTKNQLVSGLVVYDASGNTTSLSTMRMGYTAENQFWIAYDVNSGVTVEYLPDGFGNRVWKQVTGGATSYYLYDALGQLAAEYTGPTALTKEYIRMGGQLVAIQNASGTPCSTCYLTYDHLGSVRLVTDQNANIVSRHDFLPFGEEIPAGYAGRWSQFGAADKINQRFTGQDRETENIVPVDYFNARNFTGVLGRFNSPDPENIGADPMNPQSWNGYSYVGNNPLGLVDRNGKWPTSYHTYILNMALPGLSSSQFNTLNAASQWVDSMPNQAAGRSYMHGQCSPDESLDGCVEAINNWISGEIGDAQQLGFNNDGLRNLGYALHTLADMASPFHSSPDGTPTCWGCSFTADLSHVFNEDVDIGLLGRDHQYGVQISQAILNVRAGFGVTYPQQYASATAGMLSAVNKFVYSSLVVSTGSISPSTVLQNEMGGCLLGNPAACPDGGDSIFQSIMGGGGGGAYPSSGTARHPVI